MVEEMDVDSKVETTTTSDVGVAGQDQEEEDVSDMQTKLEELQALDTGASQVDGLLSIITDSRVGPSATQIKERAVYSLTRAYCADSKFDAVVSFLVDSPFLSTISKAKTAKLVRHVLDIVCEDNVQYSKQEDVARSILEWCSSQKRSFLRQRVEAKLAAILFHQDKYSDSIAIVDALLVELKKLDDKQLLVETHLLESKLQFALRNVAKAKAALTACRTCANSIYISPANQADIDSMSGTIHTEESDYGTAHSYFLEAFEQLDSMGHDAEATTALKYMMLCKILDSLRAALSLSSTGNVGIKSDSAATIEAMLTGKQAVKYAGSDLDAMQAIAKASHNRNLKELENVLNQFPNELQQDLLIKHHLRILKEQLLESNLIRIIEPYSCVELDFVAGKIQMPVPATEKKLSQMILDGKLQGTLDQGAGQLLIYEESETDAAMANGLTVIDNMDKVVTSLFERSNALRTVMM